MNNPFLAHTDVKISVFGDYNGIHPVRPCQILYFDDASTCLISVHHTFSDTYIELEVDKSNLFSEPGRKGEIPPLTRRQLSYIPPFPKEYNK
jgi:hypothetical protein